ncbi:MAG: (d)CMP kinase, partial [Bdellovibrionales bacterium]|nr:(d)CMP kinase [Bdellovibrionales bacterium]
AANHVGLDLGDEDVLAAFARGVRCSVRLTPETTRFFLDDVDFTDELMKEAVGTLASRISSYPKVRLALLEAQRRCAVGVRGLVAEGRDCGSVVFPNALVKIFLTARAEDRAARRALEEGRDLETTISEQKRRDSQDATRKAAPMVAPEGAHQVDTTGLTLAEVVDLIEKLIGQEVGVVSSLGH